MHAREPVADGMPMERHRVGGLGGGAVMGQERLQGPQQLSVVTGVIRAQRSDRLITQEFQLLRISEQHPDQQPVGFLLARERGLGSDRQLHQQLGFA